MNNTDELMNYCGESIKGIYGHFCPKFTKPFEVDLRSRLDWHRGEINWCREPELNRHGPFGPRDFKSRVSTRFHHPGTHKVISIEVTTPSEI